MDDIFLKEVSLDAGMAEDLTAQSWCASASLAASAALEASSSRLSSRISSRCDDIVRDMGACVREVREGRIIVRSALTRRAVWLGKQHEELEANEDALEYMARLCVAVGAGGEVSALHYN